MRARTRWSSPSSQRVVAAVVYGETRQKATDFSAVTSQEVARCLVRNSSEVSRLGFSTSAAFTKNHWRREAPKNERVHSNMRPMLTPALLSGQELQPRSDVLRSNTRKRHGAPTRKCKSAFEFDFIHALQRRIQQHTAARRRVGSRPDPARLPLSHIHHHETALMGTTSREHSPFPQEASCLMILATHGTIVGTEPPDLHPGTSPLMVLRSPSVGLR